MADDEVLLIAGAIFTFGFAGGFWFGERDHTATTVLYLPAVAGSFVSATARAIFGHPDWDQLAFGAGLFRGSRSNPCWSIAF